MADVDDEAIQEVIMQVNQIMCFNPATCTPDTSLQDAALMMCECDCGAIPVVDANNRRHPVGVITDRDIVCRVVAQGRDVTQVKVGDCMSHPLATIQDESDIADCCEAMESAKVRRLAVVDDQGNLCGIVSQADIALRLPPEDSAEVVREVSRPTREASCVA
jgi:CBS domain-containing protein